MSDDWTPVSDEVAALWEKYRAASVAKSHFTKQEKEIKAELCEKLGYDPDDPKPQPVNACTRDGEPLFEVKIGYRTSPDIRYIKDNYPHIYAEAERRTPSKSIKPSGE